jgi:hypothetical protein
VHADAKIPTDQYIIYNIKRVVYYFETINRKSKKRFMYECRWDDGLKSEDEGSTSLTYTGLCGRLERDFLVYFYSIKREVKRRLTHACRCDERLKGKTEGSTLLIYTGF